MSRVGVVRIPGSNPQGIVAAFSRVGVAAEILTLPTEVKDEGFDKLVLPGVGNFGSASNFLYSSGFAEVLLYAIKEGQGVLGVCLGFHLLCSASEESPKQHGLGVIDAEVKRLSPGPGRRVPHMGWSRVGVPSKSKVPGLVDGELLYFAHSYEVIISNGVDRACISTYGGSSLVAAFRQGNVVGVQFHPEKSNEAGLRLLKSFAS